MPQIDVQCLDGNCGLISEVYRAATDWPATPPCPKCDSPTAQVHLPPSTARSLAPAVVVYQMPDGTYRYPGDPNSLATHHYERQGGTRIELKGWQEVRPFEKHMNDREKATIRRRIEIQQQQAEEGKRLRRDELRHRIPSMSDGGQAFARALMRHTDAQPTRLRAYDPGFHVEAYSETRSNRDESRDTHGRKRRD